MKVKKYEAINMPQALEMIKKELGPNAVILSTRKIRKSNSIFGLLGRPVVEVTAASDYDFGAKVKIKEKGAIRKDEMNWSAARFESMQDEINRMREEMTELTIRQATGKEEKELLEFISNYDVLNKKVDAILQSTIQSKLKGFPVETVNLYKKLKLRSVEDTLAIRLIEFLEKKSSSLGESADKSEIMHTIISKSIKTAGPIDVVNGQKIVALVGPTGVGKTTTIAKLAAHYALQRKKKVGLITIDTFRIAAVEQIKTYAKIMDIPVEVALTGDDLSVALERLKFKDLILIDTAGMSPHNKKQMFELKTILTKRAVDFETHLVLSLTTSIDDQYAAFKKFRELNFRKMLLTKFDETSSYGNILNLSLRTRIPISYITTGQNVPEDIMTAESENIADLLLDGSA